MINKIVLFSKKYPKTLYSRIVAKIATIEDQDEALKNIKYTYTFARNIPDADIEKCQEAACQDSYYAYYFALNIPGADIDKCQEIACQNPFYASLFAKYIPGANIEKYQ